MAFENVSIVPPAIPNDSKSNNHYEPVKTKNEPQSVKRTIAPLTKFNPDTKMVEADEASPWSADSGNITTETEPVKTTPSNTDRHAKWKEDQAAKKEEKAANQNRKAAERQVLARDLLKKGDADGAAKALGLSKAEFFQYAQNAMLSIPTPDAELKPEEKKAKEEAQFRADRLAFEKEQKEWKYNSIATEFIRDNIKPVLSDKKKFELINAPGTDIRAIETSVYEYMNQHYNETGKILDVNDILETIEQQLYDQVKDSTERYSKLDKTKAFFATQQEAREEAAAEAAEEEEATSEEPGARAKMGKRVLSVKSEPFHNGNMKEKAARPLDSRFPTRDPDIEVEDEVEEATEVPAQASKRKEGGSKVPFAFLTPAEKMAIIREENKRATQGR